MLVDGGADTAEGWAALDAGVRRVTAGWSAVTLHVVTHMHVDHIGLARRTRDACGAPLAMGRWDAERVAGAAADPDGEVAYRAATLREAGAPERLWSWAHVSPAGGPPPLEADLALDGEGGPLPGATGWRWIWTPGHTAGHVSLLRDADGALLAGDAVLPTITPTLGVNRQRPDPVGDYLNALGRLREAGARAAWGGHGGAIGDPSGRIRELADSTRDETAAVRGLLGDAARTAWEVATARYAGRDLPVSAELQALRETLAHLRHLQRRGLARGDGDAPIRFHSAGE